MGCCTSRKDSTTLAKYNNIVKLNEEKLQLRNVQAKQMVAKLQELSQDDKISKENFLSLESQFEDFKISADLANAASPLTLFMDSFKADDGVNYNSRTLQLAVIILAQGTPVEKAELLFDHFDQSRSGAIDANKLNELVTWTVYISHSFIVSCALGAQASDTSLNHQQYTDFKSNLERNGQNAYVTNIIAQAEQTKGQGTDRANFVNKFNSNTQLQQLFVPFLVRKAIIAEGAKKQ